MAAIHQVWYGGGAAAPLICYELVQIQTQQFDGALGMGAPGAASNARADFLSRMQSFVTADMNHLTGGAPGTSTRIQPNTPRAIWSGLGTITTDNNFSPAYTANTANSASYPGRFNTTAVTAGNWLDSDTSINIALSSPRNAFCCYITDLGDFTATLEFQFRLGATLVKTVSVPYKDMNTSEVMHVGYLDGAKTFDKIRIQINQNDPNFLFDSVGFDDLVIGMMPPCTPAPNCFEQVVMTKQAQSFGGAVVGDGMPQSGPAVTARTTFLASLQSYVTASLQHVSANTSVIYTASSPLSLWSGLGSLAGKSEPGTPNFENTYVATGAANGRFNTSANVAGNYVETDYGFDITLSSTRTAFTCYVTDMGDANSIEAEFRFWNGSTLQRSMYMPVVNVLEKPSSNEAMCVAYSDGSKPFNRVEVVLNTFHSNYGDADFVGFDDLVVGHVVACVPSSAPQEFYGINTGSDAAKTVTGSALTARNNWVAAASNATVCDFESSTVGAVAGTTLALPFSGPLSASLSGSTLLSTKYSGVSSPVNHARLQATVDAVANSTGSARWNTTTSGSKWYEWTDEAKITFPRTVTGIGFYLTDLGDLNATLRVTLLRPGLNGGVTYYVPKAAQLNSPNGLLRFWGVTGEQGFDRVIIQTVYYDTLTAHEYIRPAILRSAADDIVGIDDIMVA